MGPLILGTRRQEPLLTCPFAPFTLSLQQPESLLKSTADAAGGCRGPQHTPPRGVGETEAAQPPAQRGQPQHRSRLARRPGRASLWRAGDGYLEELGSLLQELQSRTLGEAAGSPGARKPGSRRAEAETLWEGAAHPSSCRRPVRRSPQAVAAAAASGLRSPGRPREGTLKGARSPLAPVSDAGRRGC